MKKVDQSPCTELEEGEFVAQLNSNGCICEVCGKKFSTKKALGGHMRVHLNSQKKPSKICKMFSNKIIENDDSEIGDRKSTTTTCKLCGKRFWSLRSLCGHMRCHPARERRPPEQLMKSGGRENQSTSFNQSELDDDAYGAACAIMLIATGEECYKLSPKEKIEEAVNSKKRRRNEVFMKTTTVSHVSMLCDKEFLRRQAALGGHWRGSCSSSLSPPEEDGIMTGSSGEVKRVVVDVDLNELAPECGDGDRPALIA